MNMWSEPRIQLRFVMNMWSKPRIQMRLLFVVCVCVCGRTWLGYGTSLWELGTLGFVDFDHFVPPKHLQFVSS